MYDLIGDIHGYATPLRNLLQKLDYEPHKGVWQHSQRRVIFLGDFIDRGPEQVETVQIARDMVEHGKALAVMGNHEFNAVAWSMADPERPGEFLRPHSPKNRKQHREFLEQFREGSRLHAETIAWFKTLPLYLDMPGLRVVHACWHRGALDTLGPLTDEHNRLLPGAWPAVSRKGTEAFDALEIVLKGLEVRLPSGVEFRDKDNNLRQHVRTRWWAHKHISYRDLAMVPADIIEHLPHEPVPKDILPYYDGEKPVFVGHYWMQGEPAPLTPHIACLDYSIAATHSEKGDSHASREKEKEVSMASRERSDESSKLCAYRWDGETVLSKKNFEWVYD